MLLNAFLMSHLWQNIQDGYFVIFYVLSSITLFRPIVLYSGFQVTILVL